MNSAVVLATFLVPLAACAIGWLCGGLKLRRLSTAAALFGGSATVVVGAMMLVVAAGRSAPLSVALGTWLFVPGRSSLDVTLSVVVDHRSAWLIAIVTIVAGLVVLHAAAARTTAETSWRENCWLLLLIAATVWFLSCGNLLQLLIAWQGMSVASCGLAGGASDDLRRRMAVRKTALVLAVGGCGLLAAACELWSSTGSLDIAAIVAGSSAREITSGDTLAAFGILVAAIAACAQVPLFIWLPDASEESSSAAATLQCVGSGVAGIHLLMLFQSYLAHMPGFLSTVALVGGATALAGGWIAVNQMRRARRLAFITIAHVGLMWLALGTGTVAGAYAASWHLPVHAAGMSVACLAVGRTRVEKTAYAAAAAGLCGVPLLSGFWSLSAILAVVREAGTSSAAMLSPTTWTVLFWCAAGAILLTACGLFGLIGKPRSWDSENHHSDAQTTALPTWLQNAVLMLLAVMVMAVGAVIGPMTGWLAEFLPPGTPAVPIAGDVQIIVAAAALVGGLSAWLFRMAGGAFLEKVTRPLQPLCTLGRREFFLPDYFFLGLALPLRAGSLLCRFVDWFLIDRILIGTFARLPLKFAKTAQPLQNGLIQFYALMIVAAAAMILAVVQWSGGGP